MGEAGRRRACEQFAWSHVIRSYEDLWYEQDRERSARAGSESSPKGATIGPAAYPDIERSFAGYPTRWLESASLGRRGAGATDGLESCLHSPWQTTPRAGVSPTPGSSAPHSLVCLARSKTSTVSGPPRAWIAVWAAPPSPGCSNTTWFAAGATIDLTETLNHETNTG